MGKLLFYSKSLGGSENKFSGLLGFAKPAHLCFVTVLTVRFSVANGIYFDWRVSLGNMCPVNSEQYEIHSQSLETGQDLFHPAFWTILCLFIVFGILSALNEKLFNPCELEPSRDSFRVDSSSRSSPHQEEDLFSFQNIDPMKIFDADDPVGKETFENTQRNIYVGIDNSFSNREDKEILDEKNENITRLSQDYLGEVRIKKPLESLKSMTLKFSKRKLGGVQLGIPRIPSSRTEPSTVSELSPRNRLGRKKVRF